MCIIRIAAYGLRLMLSKDSLDQLPTLPGKSSYILITSGNYQFKKQSIDREVRNLILQIYDYEKKLKHPDYLVTCGANREWIYLLYVNIGS
jgi:hypothetical protein